MFITVLWKWLINNILRHFKINADISILDRSIILAAAILCLRRVPCANLRRWFSDLLATGQNKNDQISSEKVFHDLVCEVPLEMHKKYTRFYRFLLFTLFSIKSSQF